MRKILITGISGFAGSYLARNLTMSKKGEVAGTYHLGKNLSLIEDIKNNLNLFQLDLMDSKAVLEVLTKVKPDQIYHLAAIASSAQSFSEPSVVMTNNINSQLNLLEAVRSLDLKPRIMIISSAEVYGKVDAKDLPIDEDTALRPISPYAVSKLTQDFIGLQYFMAYSMDIVRVRPFNHIGPGQTDQFATSAFAKKIAEIEKGKREPVLTVGNLESKRDFTDVKDMMQAYVLLMEKGISGEVYNIGSGRSYKMSDVLNILLSFSDSKIKVEVDPALLRPSDNPELLCDNTKINSLTGWKPQIPLDATLKEILEYWRQTS
ncbi:MAG: GDP-mannose 4,6-dehydratase [Candidatus Levybacteria bacterium]|nr:GDP-mannose 4,6-dehydratase [Candidatus Levybacteria bacterium]